MPKGIPSKPLSPMRLAQRRRWCYKGRIVSVAANILSLAEDPTFTTESERLLLFRIYNNLIHVVDRFNLNSMEVLERFRNFNEEVKK